MEWTKGIFDIANLIFISMIVTNYNFINEKLSELFIYLTEVSKWPCLRR